MREESRRGPAMGGDDRPLQGAVAGDDRSLASPPGWLFPCAAVLFFLSGAASLAYEVAWVKVMTLELGCSSWSVATVVASFMAGLGAGSAWAGRRSRRFRRPLRVYGLLELGVAVFGLFSVPLLEALGRMLGACRGLLELNFALFLAARFLIAFLALCLPTFLMGASLPVLVGGIAGGGTFRWSAPLLYGINTLGAAAGTLAAGVFLIPSFGISGIVQLSVLTGGFVAAGAFWLDRRIGGVATAGEETPAGSVPEPPPLILAAVAVSGGLSISCQIAWTRLLIPVVGSSTYAFTIILTIFLLAIGLGGLLAAVPFSRRLGETGAVGWSIALASLAALASLLAVNHLPEIFTSMAGGTGDSKWLLFLSQAAVSALVLALPTLGLGLVLPLAVSGQRGRVEDGARALGGMYAANTFGSILGSILAGFLFLPLLGASGVIRLVAVLGMVLAAALVLHRPSSSRAGRAVRLGALTSALVLLFLALPSVDLRKLHSGVFRGVQAAKEFAQPSRELLYAREGRNVTVMVLRDQDHTNLKINGKTDASTGKDLDTQYLLAHLPLFLHQSPRSACIIGYGSGATVYAATTHPSVRAVDVVEIESAVVEASEFFESVNHQVLGDPRVKLHLEDGRTFLGHRNGTYDVIISEPSNPWIAGVSSLFTTDFYRIARGRLGPGGRFCQWIQLYEISLDTLKVMLSTLAGEFPHVKAFMTHGDLICVASVDAIPGDPGRYHALFAMQEVRESLARIGVANPHELFVGLLRSFPENRDLFISQVKNTDDNLWLEYRAPIEMYREVSPGLTWPRAGDYLSNAADLFPGLPRPELALHLARSVERRKPEFWALIEGVAREFAGDEDLRAELERLAGSAKHRQEEIVRNRDRIQAASGLIARMEFARANVLLEQILSSEPERGPPHRLMGWSLLQTGDAKRGLEHLLRAIEIQPDDYEARTLLALVLQAAGRRDDQGHLERALKLNPRYVQAWEVRLKGLLQDGRTGDARAGMREAEKVLTPEDFDRLGKAISSLLEE